MKEGKKIKVEMIEEVIRQKKEQGQNIAIFCYDTPVNRERVKALSDKPDNIYMVEQFEVGKIAEANYIEKMMGDKPDFVIIFTGEDNLLAVTTFIYNWGAKHVMINTKINYISRNIEVSIVKIAKEIIFKSIDDDIEYNNEYSKKVSLFWDYLLESGKTYWDDLMYSACSYKESLNSLCFEFAKTNYRNFTYSKEHDFRNEFHTCTTASIALIETSDGYSVLGKMSENSVFPEQYKCIGGALDEKDFVGDKVCFERMFSREIFEELGIDISDKSVCCSNENKWLLIREQMGFVGLCNIIKLKLSKEKLIEAFKKHREIDDEKEIDSLLFIKSMDEINNITKYEKADYVDELYRCYFGLEEGISWNEYKRKYNQKLFK